MPATLMEDTHMTAAEFASVLHLPHDRGDGSAARGTHALRRAVFYSLLALLFAAAAFVAYDPPYKAGDAVGYNMGLGGGVLMLTLLLYPLRKRLRFWDRFGSMRSWFGAHMATGILGPLLVLFHSTFRIGSINARVALYATLVVAASGIVGRFVYRHIHRGLYGRKMTLAEAEEDIRESADDVDGVLGKVPDVAGKLEEFQRYSKLDPPTMAARARHFMSLRRHGRAVADDVFHAAEAALQAQGREERWSRGELKRQATLARRLIDAYIGAVCSAAQFTVWERLFSLWHVLHVPLVYLLVICGIAHVVAVHMY
jgi:hypothetical protein